MAERTCSVEGCEKRHMARGLCNSHYQRAHQSGLTGARCSVDECGGWVKGLGLCSRHYQQKKQSEAGPCVVDGCREKAGAAKGLCNVHYIRLRKEGTVGEPERRRGKRGLGTKNAHGYVQVRQGRNGRAIGVHRLVMERMLDRPLEPHEEVHHINGIRDDNRPENLELWVVSQPAGQRATDLAEWVVDHYPELVAAAQDRHTQLRLLV